MILKNLINYFNLLYLTIFCIYVYIINCFFFTNNIKNKFFLFFFNFFILISLGLYYCLDGIIMIFFVCEFTILLVFIIMFSELYSYLKFNNNYNLSYILILLILLNFTFYNTNLIIFKNFYTYNNIILNDFFYIYNFYFEKQILLIIITLFIITIYSIFFILLYNTLKRSNYYNINMSKKITLLRKQNLIHQNNYNTQIRIFKK